MLKIKRETKTVYEDIRFLIQTDIYLTLVDIKIWRLHSYQKGFRRVTILGASHGAMAATTFKYDIVTHLFEFIKII